MQIKIYIHPEFKDAFWTKLSLKALSAEIARKRYTAEYLDADRVSDIDFDKVYAKDEKRLLLYVGHSVAGTPADLKHLTDRGVHVLLFNYESEVLGGKCSKVLLNYRDGMQKTIAYLHANKHDRIALFGINPNSSTDLLKDAYFLEYLREHGGNPSRDIYYNYGSITGCFARFAENYADYNAVICANDIVALALVQSLQSIGVRVPEDMYVTACGGSTMIATMAKTTITTVSADQYELGRQAVLTYSFLLKNPCDVALTVKVEAKLTPRASTGFDMGMGEAPVASLHKQVPNVDFYDDPVIQSIFSIEALLLSCDDLDRGILTGILQSETYPSIAERLYTSENVISYRIKRMCKITGCQKKSELVSLLSPFLKP